MDFNAVTSVFSGIPYDWFALGAFLILIALDSLRSGIGRACAIALALPLATVLYALLTKTAFVSGLAILTSSPTAQLVTFGVLALATYLLVRRMALEYIESGTGEPIQALLAGAAATVVIAVIWLQLPMAGEVWQVSGKVQALFAEQFRLLWLLGAYLALAFARG
jgi:hypothetical protein